MRRFLALLAVAPLAFGACGSNDEDAVRDAVEDYLAALETADPGAVCALFTQAELDGLGASGTCEEVYAAGFALLAEEGVELPDYEITGIEVDGDAAEVTLSAGSIDEEVPLTKEDGSWKLAGVASFDQFHPDDPIPDSPAAE